MRRKTLDRNAASASALTELEGIVLGLIWSAGWCTPYSLRTHFLRSPSVHWSGSAGAIYPLIERLAGRELLRARKTRTGKREGREYALTASGSSALNAWIAGITDGRVLSAPIDPLRNRLRFLGALDEETRRRILDDVLKELGAHLAVAKEYCDEQKRSGNRYAVWMGRGVVYALRARIAWIEEIRAGGLMNDGESATPMDVREAAVRI